MTETLQRPFVVTTWAKKCFRAATKTAFKALSKGETRNEALVKGCSLAEAV